MKDITSTGLIKLKGVLFLLIGLFASALLVLEQPTLKVAVLLAIAVWCFCRFYYFAFYVVERYVDSRYRFSGLWSFASYLIQRRKHVSPLEEFSGRMPPEGGAADKHSEPPI